ncbi:MAG: phosphohistidine phosphatase SixA [Polaromonas sp.]|jgi:phosphohistidine phosphatase SixA
MKRRTALTLLAAISWPLTQAHSAADIAALLRAGGCVFLIRHAETDRGVGDPSNFKLGDCRTQRNLSEAGREQSRRLGEWFKVRQLKAHAVYASAWCRGRDTAELAFGAYTVLPALNSTFDNETQPGPLTRILRTRLKAVPAGAFEIWVTHQVNITALTGEYTAMGEALIVDASGTVLARTTLSSSAE